MRETATKASQFAVPERALCCNIEVSRSTAFTLLPFSTEFEFVLAGEDYLSDGFVLVVDDHQL